MCRYLTDREHAAWAADWLREVDTRSSLPALKQALRWHPFNRREFIAAINEIEHRDATQTLLPDPLIQPAESRDSARRPPIG
jgi:hypothetical protein